MFSNTRSTLAIAFAATILGASPALAVPGGDDLRGENAIGVTDTVTPPADDQRSPDAREPVGGQGVAQPVVVEVTDPDGGGFDWTAAIIGMAAGLALTVLAGVAVAGSRRRPTTV